MNCCGRVRIADFDGRYSGMYQFRRGLQYRYDAACNSSSLSDSRRGGVLIKHYIHAHCSAMLARQLRRKNLSCMQLLEDGRTSKSWGSRNLIERVQRF
jgi:hypothetical protein